MAHDTLADSMQTKVSVIVIPGVVVGIIPGNGNYID